MLKSSKITSLVSVVIAISLVVSFSFSAPKKADAIWGIADAPIDAASNIFSAVKNAWNAYMATEGWWKEWVLDPIAYVVAQELLSNITDSTVNWIKSGFEGDPLYDLNFADSIKDGLNEASGVLIDKMGGAAICDNLKEGLGFSFSYTKPFEYKMKCTLKDAIENVDEFYQDFTKGGWRGWVTMTVNPQNNPYGAYITTYAEHQQLMAEKTTEKQNEISAGGGIKSFKKCDEYTSENPDPSAMGPTKKPVCKHWTIQTPGKAIESRLSEATGVDFKALGVADEMDEIISALLQQAMSAIFEEGSSSDSSGNGGGGLTNARTGEDVTPTTLKEDMANLRTKLEIYYDFFTATSTSMINGAHYKIRETVWQKYDQEERYWRLSQYCNNGGSTEGEGVKAVDYLKELTTAINNGISACKALNNAPNDIADAKGLYSDGFSDSDDNKYKGVYDSFYRSKGWSNVTSKILSKWKSKLSDLESIQNDDTSDLEMSEMQYGAAKTKYVDKCCKIPLETQILCKANPFCDICKLDLKIVKINFCGSICPCSDMANKCKYETGEKYRYCEEKDVTAAARERGEGSVNGTTCERGDTCQGGTMRPTLDSSFCCVGGTCVPDTAGPGGYINKCVSVAIPPEPPPPKLTCAENMETCSKTKKCCNPTEAKCGHLAGGVDFCYENEYWDDPGGLIPLVDDEGGTGGLAGCRTGTCSANPDVCGPSAQFSCVDNCGAKACDDFYGIPNCCLYSK